MPTVAFDGTATFRNPDGVGRYSVNLIAQFAKDNPSWRIIIIGFFDDKYRDSQLPNLPNIHYHYLPFIRKIYQGIYSRIAKIPVDAFLPKIDCFVATNFTLFPYVTKVPSLITIHDFAYRDVPETIEPRNLIYLRKRLPESVKKASGVIAVSSFTYDRLIDFFPYLKQRFLVENALDEKFLARRAHQDTVKEKYKLPNEYLLSVGTLEPRKNLQNLFLAYQKSETETPLVIVGKKGWGGGPALTNLSERTRQNIIFTGFVDDQDLPSLYQQARLFIFPSIYEGFGLPLLEAMASSVPVIAADIPPFKSIAHDLVTYFNPLEPNDIAHHIEDALDSKPNNAKIEKARELAQDYTWHNSAQHLKDAIMKTLNRPR